MMPIAYKILVRNITKSKISSESFQFAKNSLQKFKGSKMFEIYCGFLSVLDDSVSIEDKIIKLVDLRTPIISQIG
jgi:hypothetical protein